MKSVFAKFGIPEEVMSDGGLQFSSFAFQNFANHYGFHHALSSPKYAQSNGEAERAVQTVKNLLKKSYDPYLALLAYRTPQSRSGCSPAELLMGRLLRTGIPILPVTVELNWSFLSDFRKKRERDKTARKVYS